VGNEKLPEWGIRGKIRTEQNMGNYSNNGPSFSGMRTWKPFYFPKREPKTWLQKIIAGLRHEDREQARLNRKKAVIRLSKLRATLKAKKQAKAKKALQRKQWRAKAKSRPVDPAKLRQMQADKERNKRITNLLRSAKAEIKRKQLKAERDRQWAEGAPMRKKRKRMREKLARQRKQRKELQMKTKVRVLVRQRRQRLAKLLRAVASESKSRRQRELAAKEKIRQERLKARQLIRDRQVARERSLNKLLKGISKKR
jgi:hypothetical protein